MLGICNGFQILCEAGLLPGVLQRNASLKFICKGTLAVQQLDPTFLRRAMPILLVAVAVYSLLRPELGAVDARPRIGRALFDCTFVLSIAFYDGFFGPGAGTFWTMAFVLMLGFSLTRATGYTKVMNFGSNLSSLAFFLMAGQVHVLFDNLPSSIGHIKCGKLRALGVTSAEREPSLPDTPTVGDTVPGYEATAWFGIGMPKGTPRDVIEKVNAEVNRALADRECRRGSPSWAASRSAARRKISAA